MHWHRWRAGEVSIIIGNITAAYLVTDELQFLSIRGSDQIVEGKDLIITRSVLLPARLSVHSLVSSTFAAECKRPNHLNNKSPPALLLKWFPKSTKSRSPGAQFFSRKLLLRDDDDISSQRMQQRMRRRRAAHGREREREQQRARRRRRDRGAATAAAASESSFFSLNLPSLPTNGHNLLIFLIWRWDPSTTASFRSSREEDFFGRLYLLLLTASITSLFSLDGSDCTPEMTSFSVEPSFFRAWGPARPFCLSCLCCRVQTRGRD